MEYLGKVYEVMPNGPVYVEQESTGKRFSFNLSRIVGYKGELPWKLRQFSPKGLDKEVLVIFTVHPDGERIASVRPLRFLSDEADEERIALVRSLCFSDEKRVPERSKRTGG